MKIVPGPDFPTGGYIAGRDGIEPAYKTGRGSFIMRAKAAIEAGGKDRENIVITEIPYQVNKSRLIERIADLVQNKKIEGICRRARRIRSRRHAHRHRSQARRRSPARPQHLFKHTQMQESFGMILLAIVGGPAARTRPARVIRLFIEHRLEVVRRRTRTTCARPKSANTFCSASRSPSIISTTSSSIIRGQQVAPKPRELAAYFTSRTSRSRRTASPEKLSTARTSRLSKTRAAARPLGFTDRQIDAILELQLHRLTQLSVDEILKELKSIREQHRRAEGNSGERQEIASRYRRRAARKFRKTMATSAARKSSTASTRSSSRT